MRSIASCSLIGKPRSSISGLSVGVKPGTPANAGTDMTMSAATIAADRTKRMAISSLQRAGDPSELGVTGREVHLCFCDVKGHPVGTDRGRVVEAQDVIVAGVVGFVGVELPPLSADLDKRHRPAQD